MNRKLVLTLFLALALPLGTCRGSVPTVSAPSTPNDLEPTTTSTKEPTLEPTVIPTEVPTLTAVPTEIPTLEPFPTVVPADVATPTSISATPTVWEIAEAMLTECSGSPSPTDYTDEERLSYWGQLTSNAIQTNLKLGSMLVKGGAMVAANDGENHNPFNFFDLEAEGEINFSASCELFVVFYEGVPENVDGDGVLTGEAYLFYEVGGTQPYVLDGELREIHFTFPPL